MPCHFSMDAEIQATEGDPDVCKSLKLTLWLQSSN